MKDRSGIVLTATPEAKRMRVKTAMVYWEARQKCRDLIIVRADYGEYRRKSQHIRQVLARYSDQIEPFGLDEAWVDATGSTGLFGTAAQIAKEISDIIKLEVGLTTSIGISHNKTLAKLGSDYRKPDAITQLGIDNWKEIAFHLPVGDMMLIGHRTAPKLERIGIHTIGDLAVTPMWVLEQQFGKMGQYYWLIANGLDQSPVALKGTSQPEVTIGNSQTAPYDLSTEREVRQQFIPLAESVAAKVRDAGYTAWCISIYLRDKDLPAAPGKRSFRSPPAWRRTSSMWP